MSPTPKQYNELAARLARLETLLESNDVMSPPGAVKLDDLEFGPSQDFTIPDYSQYFTDMIGARDPSLVWDAESAGYDPTQFQQFWDRQMEQNYGFAPTDSAINDLMQRLANLETLTAGTIRDTSQAGALDAITDGNVSGASSGTLGTISSQNADAVAITGGSIVGITDLAVADGGTGSSTAAGARTNLGLGTIATQNANAVSVTGGSATNLSSLSVFGNPAITGLTTLTAPSASDADMLTVKDSGSDAQVIVKTTTIGGRIDVQTATGTQVIKIRYNGTTGYAELAVTNVSGLQITTTADLLLSGNKTAFFTGTPQLQQTVTGSRGANAALASLLTKLASYGLIVDSST